MRRALSRPSLPSVISARKIVPVTDSVKYAVRRSFPPNATLVIDAPAMLRKTSTGSARAFRTHAQPSPGLQTIKRPASSMAMPSGPLGPYDVKNWPALPIEPSGNNGVRQTQLPLVIAT